VKNGCARSAAGVVTTQREALRMRADDLPGGAGVQRY
jgi:hypothetical protein